jgi:hypothetical protein
MFPFKSQMVEWLMALIILLLLAAPRQDILQCDKDAQ